jgi:predicted transcriptional regulator
MDGDLVRIGNLRKKLGLTQKRLAKLSGVSQSLIAKIESAKIDPAYSKVMKIMAALSREQSKKESRKRTKDIMSTDIFCVEQDASISAAIDLMKRKDISQLPVMEEEECIGSISEGTIVESIQDFGKKLANATVEEVMDESFPIVPIESDIEVITGLLKYYKAVLIKSKGKIMGIITKADLLKAV